MLGRIEQATAAKAAFVAKHGEPSAEQWLKSGRVDARTMERHLLIEAVYQVELPV
jgi:hypothetical protein